MSWVTVFRHVERQTAGALYHGSDPESVLSYITTLERQLRAAQQNVEGVNQAYEKVFAELTEAKRATRPKLAKRVALLEEQVASLMRGIEL